MSCVDGNAVPRSLRAFDLIKHNRDDLYGRPFADPRRQSCSTMHTAEDGPTVFERACQLGTERLISKKRRAMGRITPDQSAPAVWIKVRNPTRLARTGSAPKIGNR
jgi:ATP-dependent DNA ligase